MWLMRRGTSYLVEGGLADLLGPLPLLPLPSCAFDV